MRERGQFFGARGVEIGTCEVPASKERTVLQQNGARIDERRVIEKVGEAVRPLGSLFRIFELFVHVLVPSDSGDGLMHGSGRRRYRGAWRIEGLVMKMSYVCL